MQAYQQLIGFDARWWWTDRSPSWDDDRSHKFLLRLDITQPASVDKMVWSSIFDAGEWCQPHYNYTSPQVRWDEDLWMNLEQLKRVLGNTGNDSAHHSAKRVIVAITVAVLGQLERRELELVNEITIPTNLNYRWTFLGYDIADRWLLSGLSDCGYEPDYEDVDALRSRWAPRLNALHLFDSLNHAAEFRSLADRRVKEHSPFYIYGIWEEKKGGQEKHGKATATKTGENE